MTPNIHMHCHLASCVNDYGPISSFWLFPFERYNGLLGDQPRNNHSIEAQIMKRFVEDNSYLLHDIPDNPVSHVFKDIVYQHASMFLSVKSSNFNTDQLYSTTSGVRYKMNSKYTLGMFSSHLIDEIHNLYETLYARALPLSIPCSFKKMMSITLNGISIFFGDYVLAKMTSQKDQEEQITIFTNTAYRPAHIKYFAAHSIPSQQGLSHVFAIVDWPQKHPLHMKIGKPVEVWCNSVFERCSSIIPIEYISMSLFVAHYKLYDETVLITVPRV